jgi:hypothetical protein
VAVDIPEAVEEEGTRAAAGAHHILAAAAVADHISAAARRILALVLRLRTSRRHISAPRPLTLRRTLLATQRILPNLRSMRVGAAPGS